MIGVKKHILSISGQMRIAADIQPDGFGNLQVGLHTIPFRLLIQCSGNIKDLDGTVQEVSVRHLWPETKAYLKISDNEKFSISSEKFGMSVSVKKEDVEKLFLAVCYECMDLDLPFP